MNEWSIHQPPTFFELDLTAVTEQGVPVVEQISKFPSVNRDVAVVVDESISHDQVIDIAWSTGHDGILKDVTLFDVYRPSFSGERGLQIGQKSMAIRLIMNDMHGTLSDDQIEDLRMKVIDALSVRANAKLRD